jgi:hypothetical protein
VTGKFPTSALNVRNLAEYFQLSAFPQEEVRDNREPAPRQIVNIYIEASAEGEPQTRTE